MDEGRGLREAYIGIEREREERWSLQLHLDAKVINGNSGRAAEKTKQREWCIENLLLCVAYYDPLWNGVFRLGSTCFSSLSLSVSGYLLWFESSKSTTTALA